MKCLEYGSWMADFKKEIDARDWTKFKNESELSPPLQRFYSGRLNATIKSLSWIHHKGQTNSNRSGLLKSALIVIREKA